MFVMILQRIYFSINHNFAATRSLFDHLKVDDQIWDFKLFLFIHSFGNHFLNHKIRLQSVLDLRWRRFEWIYICPHSSNQVRSKVTGGSGRLTFGSRRWSLFQTRIAPNVYPTSYGTSFETVLKLQRFFKGAWNARQPFLIIHYTWTTLHLLRTIYNIVNQEKYEMYYRSSLIQFIPI